MSIVRGTRRVRRTPRRDEGLAELYGWFKLEFDKLRQESIYLALNAIVISFATITTIFFFTGRDFYSSVALLIERMVKEGGKEAARNATVRGATYSQLGLFGIAAVVLSCVALINLGPSQKFGEVKISYLRIVLILLALFLTAAAIVSLYVAGPILEG